MNRVAQSPRKATGKKKRYSGSIPRQYRIAAFKSEKENNEQKPIFSIQIEQPSIII
jgi:hypothetical protein